MTSSTDVAAAAAVVNDTTARLLADKDVNKHISAPAPVGPDEYNPLAVSAHSGPLDYYPTLESRDIPKYTPEDGNEIGKIQADLQASKEAVEKKAEKVDPKVAGAIIEKSKTEATPDSSPKPGDSKTPNVQHSDEKPPADAGALKVEVVKDSK